MKTTAKSSILLVLALCAACKNNTAPVYPDNTNTIMVEAEDTDVQVLAKAIECKPSARQQLAMDDEFIAFVHFGPNTFTAREWGTGTEDPTVFNPTNLDTDQWCRVMKEAGMKKVVLTVKHHDGYVIYQTRYTDHGIMSSPFMDGKGDVLRSLSESCAKYGLKLGVYLSPADLWQMEDGNLYGNESPITMRTIPKQVEGRPFADTRTFQFECDDYNEYYMSQLFELLTEYGPIHEIWLDGAHPKHKGDQQYNYTAWREMIRTLAPDAVVFGREDIRWVGNEAGNVRDLEWNVIPYTGDNPDTMVRYYDMTDKDLATTQALLNAPRPFWLHYQPAETDTSIREGWFFRDDESQGVRSADNVFDIYERAVGGNSIFILNLPPTKDGVLGERDVQTMEEVGRRIHATYDVNLLAKPFRKPVEVSPDGLVLKMKKAGEINRVMLCEPVGYTGERIERFAVDVWNGTDWLQVAEDGNVGRKCIVRFATVKTDKIRVRILDSRAQAILSSVSAHFYAERPFMLKGNQSENGIVTITADTGDFNWQVNSENSVANLNPSSKIFYTLDGTEPDETSSEYTEPFAFENGIVKAVSYVNGEFGEVLTFPAGWSGANWSIDIQPYVTKIDCGKVYDISRLEFVPNINNYNGDYVSKAVTSISLDGKKWTKVAENEFGNIINNPIPRDIVRFDEPVKARYIKMDVLELVGDGDGFQSRDSEIHAY